MVQIPPASICRGVRRDVDLIDLSVEGDERHHGVRVRHGPALILALFNELGMGQAERHEDQVDLAADVAHPEREDPSCQHEIDLGDARRAIIEP